MNSALRSFTLSLLTLLAASLPSTAPAQPGIADQANGKLKIYFVDVEFVISYQLVTRHSLNLFQR